VRQITQDDEIFDNYMNNHVFAVNVDINRDVEDVDVELNYSDEGVNTIGGKSRKKSNMKKKRTSRKKRKTIKKQKRGHKRRRSSRRR
jgi:hypothetical protein